MAGYDRQTPSVNCCLAPIETWGLRPKNPEKSQNVENLQKQNKCRQKKQTNKSISMIADKSEEEKYATYLTT